MSNNYERHNGILLIILPSPKDSAGLFHILFVKLMVLISK